MEVLHFPELPSSRVGPSGHPDRSHSRPLEEEEDDGGVDCGSRLWVKMVMVGEIVARVEMVMVRMIVSEGTMVMIRSIVPMGRWG